MKVTKEEYSKMADNAVPPSPVVVNCVRAFLFGGGICCFGELLNYIYKAAGVNEQNVKILTPSTIIVITAVLTGFGVFDKIARWAGAGTIVPITGFANSVVSPALEFQNEGFILGTAAQMFTIAGPVLVYGTSAAVLWGVIVYIFKLF